MLRPAILVASSHDADEIKKCGLGEYDIIDISTEHPELDVGRRYLCYGKTTFAIINGKGIIDVGDKKSSKKIEGYGIHFGLRRDEIFHRCTKIPYLRTAKGYLFKFCYLDYRRSDPSWLNAQSYQQMLANYEQLKLTMRDLELATGISKKNGKPWYRMTYKEVRLSDDAKAYLTDESYVKDPPQLKYVKMIRSKEDLINSMNYFIDLPIGTYIGLDYETHGYKGNAIPFESPYFGFMGFALATCDGIAAYFDMEYYSRPDNEDIMQVFRKLYKKFLDKHGSYCITYNVGFETRCTYLLFNKMYMFQEASSLNKIEGNNEYNYTLKFTAQKYLPGIGSWDDAFEDYQGLFWNLFAHTTIENYKESDDWKSIVEFSSDPEINADINEVEYLVEHYWDDVFACIPYNVLGKYCCKDSYHTVLIRKTSDDLGYSQLCWKTFDDNMRMSAWLDITGQYIDYELNRDYSRKAWWYCIYGKLNVARAYVKWKLNELGDVDINDLPNELQKVLSTGHNPFNSKDFLKYYVITQELIKAKELDESDTESDTEDASDNDDIIASVEIEEVDIPELDNNFDRDKLARETTDEFADLIKSLLPKVYNYKKSARSRKLWSTIDSVLTKRWNYQKFEDGSCSINGIKFESLKSLLDVLSYKAKLDRLSFIIDNIELNEVQEDYRFDEYTNISSSKMLSYVDGVCNTNAPDTKEMLTKYLTPYLTSLVVEQFMRPEVFKDSLSINTYQESEWNTTFDNVTDKSYYFKLYHDMMKAIPVIARQAVVAKDLTDDESKILFDNLNRIGKDYSPLQFCIDNQKYVAKIPFDGCEDNYLINADPFTPKQVVNTAVTKLKTKDAMISRSMFGSYFGQLYLNSELKDEFLDKFEELDASEHSMRGQAKFGACYLMARKFIKSAGAYLDGKYPGAESTMLSGGHRITSEPDENDIIIEKWNRGDKMDTKNSIQHLYSRFHVMEKKSLRWSAGLHTLPAHGTASQVKRCVTAPKGHLMSYFDISGAEVRSVAYLSQDPFMMEAYSTPKDETEEKYVGTDESWRIKGKDPYIGCAKIIRPGLEESAYKKMRKSYKQILLGSIYGMGAGTLAGRINDTKENAQVAHDELFSILSGMERYIQEKSSYPDSHGGYIDSVLGNKINVAGERDDKQTRLGINLVVQGFSAIALAAGFQHNIQASFEDYDKWKLKVRPINVVHDSSQCIFNADGLFRIQEFYAINMQKYLWDTYHINFAFDTLVGSNYYDMCELHTIEYDKKISLNGTKYAVDKILSKLAEVGTKYKILELTSGDTNCLNEDGSINNDLYKSKGRSIVEGLLLNDDPYYFDDESNYTIILEKIN